MPTVYRVAIAPLKQQLGQFLKIAMDFSLPSLLALIEQAVSCADYDKEFDYNRKLLM